MATVVLTTGLALSAVAPYEEAHEDEKDQLQVQMQENSFCTGELTLPSQKALKQQKLIKQIRLR
ncbi:MULTISPECIES: hypothetical protein [Bacillus]|uniref:hypothetical protein n=1 Tax=Bacillus TaxID=1386 RepID=UPI00114537C3